MSTDPSRRLSPLRNTSQAGSVPELVAEQLAHFGIDEESEYGRALGRLAARLYESEPDLERLWQLTLASIGGLDRSDRIAWFNATKFLAFQFAKLLDLL